MLAGWNFPEHNEFNILFSDKLSSHKEEIFF